MEASHQPVLQLLGELLAVPAPSGREERMAALVRAKLDQLGYEYSTDPAGNVLVPLEGQNPEAPRAVFAAHMDEIGLVVTRIEEDGRLRVDRSGGLLPHKIGERPLQIIGDKGIITGVLSMGSGHGSSAEKAVSWADTWIITGLSRQQLKEAGIRPGSTAVPLAEGRGPVLFGDPADPLAGAWTFDDRMGVAVLLTALKAMKEEGLKPYRPTTIAFTIHEEGGAHGAKLLAHREKPEVFVAVDGCPMQAGSGLSLSGQPAIWSKDGKGHYDQRLVKALARAASQAGTEAQIAVLGAGVYSDATAVYDSGGAPRVAIIGHVRENSHGYEVLRLSCVQNVVRTLLKFMQMPDWE